MKAWKKFCLLTAGLLVAAAPIQAFAQQSESDGYKVDEVKFGTGGVLDASSEHYKAKQGTGDVFAGPTKSLSFKSSVGSETEGEPVLEFMVSSPGTDLGILHADQTAYGTADVWVKSYRSSGYDMYIVGTPPAHTAHTVAALGELSTAQTGIEQFGINLRENSVPEVGADPIQVPDPNFAFGVPTTDYDTPNFFKFAPNDLIAQSVVETGQTRYKLSYIVNVAPNTPAGRYTTNLSIVISSKF